MRRRRKIPVYKHTFWRREIPPPPPLNNHDHNDGFSSNPGAKGFLKPLRFTQPFRLALTRRPPGFLADHVGAVGRHIDRKNLTQARVEHAAADARVDFVDRAGGGDHRGQLGVIAVVEDLVELFARPGGGALRAQVIQDQQRRRAHLVEQARRRTPCCSG